MPLTTQCEKLPLSRSTVIFRTLLACPLKNGIYKSPSFHGRGLKIINMGELFANPRIGVVSMNRVELTASEAEQFRVQPGDLLFARRSLVLEGAGKCSVVVETDGPTTFESSIIRARPDPSKASPIYLFYFWNSVVGQYCLSLIRRQVAVAGITGSDLAQLEIPLPPLPEQLAIATALSDADALIDSLERLIEKKRDIKQATMQQLLTGETRLPGFKGAWERKRLGTFATVYSGGTPLTSNTSFYGGNIPWITSTDLNQGFIHEVEGRITHLGLENSSAKMIERDTLLLALYGATAGVAAISKITAAINQAVLAILPRGLDTLFLYFKLQYLKKQIIGTFTQGGQPNLSGEIVKNLELKVPPTIEEQISIAKVLTDMDAELSALEKRRKKTILLKQGMMQELLTGRIRLA